tara:strand:+ start:4042 stop:5646 length:1605 start_codon:yes stop_codon:yes gene_type:complete
MVSVSIRWLTDLPYQLANSNLKVQEISFSKLSVKRILFSSVILSLSLFSTIYLTTGRTIHHPKLEQVILLLLAIWWLTGFISGKFKSVRNKNIYYSIGPVIKSNLFFLLCLSASYYFFQLDNFGRQIIFGTIIIFSFIEITVFLLYFMKNSSLKPSVNFRPLIYLNDQQAEKSENKLKVNKKICRCLYNGNQFGNNDLNDFVNKYFQCNNENCSPNCLLFLSTKKTENFQHINDSSQQLIINLESINNMLSINRIFLTMRKKLKSDGMLVGSFSPLEEDYNRLRSKMPKFLYTLISPLHFLIFRIIPKMPVLGTIYDFLTQGRNRLLSKAEVYGRLSYCGYQLLDTLLHNHRIYFIADIKKEISDELSPSYGPIVKLKRMGLDGRIISIYKFRTMHPYSEFIQKDIFMSNQLNITGKINNDFRITTWGKVLRKLWIDEFPQIYNWLRGDLSLVGVRALSLHYFSLYPRKLQVLRTKLKPGLIPPYYADMPKNFNQIVDSEMIYLEKKIKRAFFTDLEYFLKALNNIIFKGARSQ